MNTADRFPPGSKWQVRDTDRNRKNGLAHGKYVMITFVDATHISVVLPAHDTVRRKVPLEAFGLNFTREPLAPHAPAYVGTRHADTLYE